jgi:hypothetical protein
MPFNDKRASPSPQSSWEDRLEVSDVFVCEMEREYQGFMLLS